MEEAELLADGQVESVANGNQHLEGGQRVAAEGEEVVVEAHRRDPEQVLPDVDNDLLVCGLGCCVVSRRGPVVSTWRRQRCCVELAVGGQGQRLDPDERGRDRMDRDRLGEEGAEFGRRAEIGIGSHLHPRGEDRSLRGRVRGPESDRGPRHGRVALERVLDLDGFEPDAPHLHLLVDAAEIDERLIVGHADQVARPVPPPAVELDERIGCVGATEIAGGEADMGDEELALATERNVDEMVVDHAQRHAGSGSTDRHLGPTLELVAVDLVDHAADDGFRRPVLVEEAHTRKHVAQPVRQRSTERLAAHDQGPQGV